ncbi:MAG: hypothetical protein GC160_02015 [Acidobacteria bacterium]|nr:hypothetical protein [Acidobacteriota bacterium]
MLQRWILLLMLIPLAVAQEAEKKETAPPKEPLETRIVKVHHIAPSELPQLFAGNQFRVMPSNALGVVSLTGTKEQVDWAAQQIQLLDLASVRPKTQEVKKNVEVMVHYLGADVGTQAIPAGSRLNAVVEQLRESFPYDSFTLLSSYMIRAVVSGGAKVEASGAMPPMGYEAPDPNAGHRPVAAYEISFELPMLEGEEPNRVAMIRRLRAHWRFPVPTDDNGRFEYRDAEIQTNVDLPEGKLVVLGKAGLPGEDKGIFLVLEARPVD